MRKLILAAAILAASPALALEFDTGTELGTSLNAVTDKLAEMGYEVRKSEIEDGLIEAYFIKGQEKGEVYVSARTGEVVKIKMK